MPLAQATVKRTVAACIVSDAKEARRDRKQSKKSKKRRGKRQDGDK